MSKVIASQLNQETNAYLRERLPGLHIVDIAAGPDGFEQVPEDAGSLILLPINVRGVDLKEAPSGWPWSLEWVQLVSSGIDFYPRWVFDAPRVSSAKGANANQVAEFALAAIFAAAKRLPDIWVKNDTWQFSPLQPVKGATLGILGLGAIGSSLAHKALALGMRVVALGRPGQPLAGIPGIEAADDIHHLFGTADHLVVAAPLTAATRHLLNREVLASAKPGLHLINLARGGLLDQQALLEALDSGAIGRATLDVTDPEPLPNGHPLYAHPRVHISPHTSALSSTGLRAFVDDFVANHQRFQQGAAPHNLVDIHRGY